MLGCGVAMVTSVMVVILWVWKGCLCFICLDSALEYGVAMVVSKNYGFGKVFVFV